MNNQLTVSSRICRTCKCEKSSESFYKDARYPGGDIHCSDCRKSKVRSWRKANPERAKAIEKNSRSKNPQAARDRANEWHAKNRSKHLEYMANRRKTLPLTVKSSALKHQFGITLDEYNALLIKQCNACAICQKTPEQNGKRLAVDHCHASSKIRGLLCSTCNQAIGLLKDNITLLKSAISYLQ